MARTWGAWVTEEERVIGQTIQKRGFFLDLEDGMLDRSSSGIRQGVEVQRNDGDSVRKLFYGFRNASIRFDLRTKRKKDHSPTYLRAE